MFIKENRRLFHLTSRQMANNSTVRKDCFNDYCEDTSDYISRIELHLVPTTFEILLIFLYVAVFLVGLVGNVMVCYAVLRTAAMRTVTNTFLVNLAIGDLLVIILCLPTTLMEDIRETWYFGPTTCRVAKFLQVSEKQRRIEKIKRHTNSNSKSRDASLFGGDFDVELFAADYLSNAFFDC